MSERLQGWLGFTGVLLFLIGLLTGFGIPAFRSPRIGLSAHLAAIQSGLALVAVGLLGSRLVLGQRRAAIIAHTLWISLYVLWVGLLFAAIFGTGGALPIAGSGVHAARWQEAAAGVLIAAGSLGSASAVALLLVRWSWRAS